MAKPVVAIIGRPNVGKSTLYNRLLKRRHAIVDDQPGVTRDRLASDMEWNGVSFTLLDTGGLMAKADEEMDSLVSAAAEAAIEEADRIVFVVDGKLGLTDLDQAVARKVQRSDKPVILAVTKMDDIEEADRAWEYYSLGLGDPLPVSGVNGLNTGDLLDQIVEGLEESEEVREEGEVRLAVLGRPNVGKSSLVNRLIGKDAQIVSEVPGTTRDAVDHRLRYHGRPVVLVDTAGLRRKHTLPGGESLDYYTALRTVKAVESCDVAAVLLDASEGLTQYERRLLDDVRDKGKGVIALFNKWDLVDKDHTTLQAETEEFRLQLPDLDFVPLLFVSALSGQRARKLLDTALDVADERHKRVPTSALNRYFEEVVAATPPPSVKGKWLKIKYVSQVATAPPVIAFHMNHPHLMPDHYKRFLERKLREEFGFEGVPVRIALRKK